MSRCQKKQTIFKKINTFLTGISARRCLRSTTQTNKQTNDDRGRELQQRLPLPWSNPWCGPHLWTLHLWFQVVTRSSPVLTHIFFFKPKTFNVVRVRHLMMSHSRDDDVITHFMKNMSNNRGNTKREYSDCSKSIFIYSLFKLWIHVSAPVPGTNILGTNHFYSVNFGLIKRQKMC